VSVANGVVYAGSADTNLYAYDTANGDLLWTGSTGGYGGTPIIADGTVYFGSADRNLYAFRLP
jgi:outer membrane protein assembly factor BamB